MDTADDGIEAEGERLPEAFREARRRAREGESEKVTWRPSRFELAARARWEKLESKERQRDELQREQVLLARMAEKTLNEMRLHAIDTTEASAKRQWLIIAFAAIGSLIGLVSLILSILVIVGAIST